MGTPTLAQFKPLPPRARPVRPTRTEPGDPFPGQDGHVVHPLVAPGAVAHRAYQVRLARTALESDLLAVLPTGLGKTVVAALAAAETLHCDPTAQVVFVAPTRPLVLQHARTLQHLLDLDPRDVVHLTGQDSPDRRARAFPAARIVATTPQGLAEDIQAGRVRLDRTLLLVVDEAHRTVGDYAYVPLVKAFRHQSPQGRVLGLTASPGGNQDRIREVLEHLGGPHVASLSERDPEVAPYVQGTGVTYAWSEPTPLLEACRRPLEAVLAERLKKIRPFLPRGAAPRRISKTQLLEAGKAIRARLHRGGSRGYLFAAMLHQATAMEADHCLELVETQGIVPFRTHLERLASSEKPSRSQASFLKESRIQELLEGLRGAPERTLEHPKEPILVAAVQAQLSRDPDSRVLVFAQYRDTVARIVQVLDTAGIAAARFVGQGNRDGERGLTQKQQQEVVASFERGDMRVLVATSVAEEGLHVPAVDLVVFHEPLVSEIRTIQRRGRTGRTRVGRVVVLATHGTRDAVRVRVGGYREAAMRRTVGALGAA